MPEAAVDKDDLPGTWEDQVRRPRQVAIVQRVSVAKRPHERSHPSFGRCVACPHERHSGASLRRRQRVGHDALDFALDGVSHRSFGTVNVQSSNGQTGTEHDCSQQRLLPIVFPQRFRRPPRLAANGAPAQRCFDLLLESPVSQCVVAVGRTADLVDDCLVEVGAKQCAVRLPALGIASPEPCILRVRDEHRVRLAHRVGVEARPR